MKILELTLINFARIYSGLGKTKLTLDFNNIENQITLFVGDNGSGKTSIMGCLHPFAYNNATGDSTSNSDLIIEKKDGKKIIKILSDDGDIYDIEHVYSRKKDDSISVKSFVKENGIELNDSGTISTFKSIILDKLGIDQTYLTLLSIGNTVKSFVDFTTSDRKNYATKIFSELEIYGKHYKNLTTMDRNMKALLNNVVSKLSKYANVNRTELENNIRDLERKINRLNNEKIELSQYIGGLTNQLETYQDAVKKHDLLERSMTDLLLEMTKLKSELVYFDSLEKANKGIVELTNEIQTKNIKKAELKNEVTYKLDMKQTKLSTLDSVDSNLSKLSSNQNVTELQELKEKLIIEIDDIKSKCDIHFNIGITKDELIKAIIYLDNLKSICDNFILDVLNQDSIVLLFEEYRKNHNLINDITSRYNYAVSELQQYSALTNNPVNVKIPPIRETCEIKHCQYKLFYDNCKDIVNKSDVQIQNKLHELEKKVGKLSDALSTLTIIERCENHIKKYHDVLSKAGCVFDEYNYVIKYMETKNVYDSDKAQDYVDTMELIEKYHSLSNKLTDTNDILKYFENNIELYNSLIKEKECLERDITKYNEEYNNIKVEYDKLYDEIEELESILLKYKGELDILEHISMLNTDIDKTRSELSNMDSIMIEIENLKSKKSNYQSKMNIISTDIIDSSREKDRLNVILTNIESLQAEEIEIRERYDLINNIRFAVSPTTGIPLEFIEYYVKEEMIGKINNLLDSVYHGRLTLIKEMVVVDDKEFTIPYMKNNSTIVKDISKASDGERAILSIAFSLVLIQLSCNKYNIMLLDEIDTSLDNTSRSKFIDLLEEYMRLIKAEQLFLISHNNMFDSYPVNVILLSDYQSFNYSNANIMRIF